MDGGLDEVAVEGHVGPPGGNCISPWVRPDDEGMPDERPFVIDF